jgi:hypothetical protein
MVDFEIIVNPIANRIALAQTGNINTISFGKKNNNDSPRAYIPPKEATNSIIPQAAIPIEGCSLPEIGPLLRQRLTKTPTERPSAEKDNRTLLANS